VPLVGAKVLKVLGAGTVGRCTISTLGTSSVRMHGTSTFSTFLHL